MFISSASTAEASGRPVLLQVAWRLYGKCGFHSVDPAITPDMAGGPDLKLGVLGVTCIAIACGDTSYGLCS